MAEYIERSSVHTLVKQLEKFQMYNYDRTQSIVGISPDDMDFGIDEIPAEDVAPVRHGQWVVKREYNDILKIDVEKYTCSACGDYWLTAVGLSLANNYCPNCGARMDG